MSELEHHDSIEVFVGVDVGKGAHHAFALDRKGKPLLDSALPNDESKLRASIGKLKEHGQILLVVDQPATIGALPAVVARAEGVQVSYLPGLANEAHCNFHAGEAKDRRTRRIHHCGGRAQHAAYAAFDEDCRQPSCGIDHVVQLLL